jgi:hypothetical protein
VNGTYDSTGQTVSSKALYGFCPAHNLYGSINAYPDASTADNIVPVQDSINTFSSAYEVLGLPPTYATNHLLIPFLGPRVYFTSTGNIASSSQNSGYTVQAVCPDWPRTGTALNTTGRYSFTPIGYSTQTETVNTYSTYYPGATYSDGTSTDYYPPAIAGCTPVSSATTALPNASSTNPWWGWSPSNAKDDDPDTGFWGSSVNNCTFNYINGSGTRVSTPDTTTTAQAAAPFTASYNNCALAIQSLGNNVSSLPTYYTYTMNTSAFTNNTTGNPAGITALTPYYSGGPSSTVSIASQDGGTYLVNEPTAEGSTGSPPEDMSHHCYNPQANGLTSSFALTDNGTPVDPFENPQYGAVLCNTSGNLPSYALYWNDMGAYANQPRYNDDLGYQNAITVFTCPRPSSTSGGGAATLSQ